MAHEEEDEFGQNDDDPEGYRAVLDVIRGYEERMRVQKQQGEHLHPNTLVSNAANAEYDLLLSPGAPITSNRSYPSNEKSRQSDGSNFHETDPVGRPVLSHGRQPSSSSSMDSPSLRSANETHVRHEQPSLSNRRVSGISHATLPSRIAYTNDGQSSAVVIDKYNDLLPIIDHNGDRRRTSLPHRNVSNVKNGNAGPGTGPSPTVSDNAPSKTISDLGNRWRLQHLQNQPPTQDTSKWTYDELLQKHKAVLARIEELEEERLCVICTENLRMVLLTPCGHLCICEGCSKTLSTCPLCRQPIKRLIKTKVLV